MLQEKQRTKLTKQILLFSSNHDGEILAAVAAANRTLAKSDSSWHDVIEALNGRGANGSYHDAFDQGLDAGYGAGYADGYRRGSQDTHPNSPNHYEMLCQLKRKEHVLNDWSKSFIDNLYSHRDWHLTEKQKRCVERIYKQFCR